MNPKKEKKIRLFSASTSSNLHDAERTTDLSHSRTFVMPGPTNTLLIEGSFTELVEELASYIDNIRKNTEAGGALQSDVSPLLEKLREQEQSEEELTDAQEEQILKQRDEVLKKVVLAATALNAAPEKGSIHRRE